MIEGLRRLLAVVDVGTDLMFGILSLSMTCFVLLHVMEAAARRRLTR